MTNAIETQLAKTVAEVAEKDEEIASLQHAGEEVEAEHLVADAGGGETGEAGTAVVPDAAPEVVDDATGEGEVGGDDATVAGDAEDGEVSQHHLVQAAKLNLDLSSIWVWQDTGAVDEFAADGADLDDAGAGDDGGNR